MLEQILKPIDSIESDVDGVDVESCYHYYVVEFDGIGKRVVISIIEAYEVYDSDVDIYRTVENAPDIIHIIKDVSDNMFINALIDYINRQEYNVYESLIQFKGLALF